MLMKVMRERERERERELSELTAQYISYTRQQVAASQLDDNMLQVTLY